MEHRKYKPIPVRLAAKIKKDLALDCDPDTFYSNHASRAMLQNGVWSWGMLVKGDQVGRPVGSVASASELVKKKYRLDIDDCGEIYGEKIKEKG